MQFWSPEDANARLGTTIIKFRGDWVYVKRVQSDWSMTYSKLSDVRTSLDCNIRNLKIGNPDVELGWCLLEGQLLYAERLIPTGQNRSMGLRPRNVVFTRAGEVGASSDLGSHVIGATLIPLFEGLYKSITHYMTQNTGSFPLSKRFSVVQTTLNSWRLYHRNEVVGEFSSRDKLFTFYPSQFHLKEALERVLEASNQGAYSVVCYE